MTLQVSVEKAVKVIGNRFDLVLKAAKRARQLQDALGTPHVGSQTNEKPAVTALKEIQSGLLPRETLEY